jgi:hypothetical protein
VSAPAQPLPLRILVDEATTQLRRHFRAIYFPVAIPLALAAGAFTLTQMRWFKVMMTMQTAPDPFAMLSSMGVLMVWAFAFVCLGIVAQTAMMIASVDALSGKDVSMARAWRTALSPRILGTVILAALLIGAGTVCCVLPGVYAAVVLSVIVPVMAAEGQYGSDALLRSNQLLTYNPQGDLLADPRVKAFVVLFVGWLLGYVVGLVVSVPAAVIQQVVIMRQAASGARVDPATLAATMAWLQVPAAILGMLARGVIMLYVCFGLGLLFFDLRGRREGADLEAAIGSLGGGVE